ncbi:MAG: DNA-binding protein [Desulfohalobiaceae bacterium]|nr:DNA-binding protein [Desulfohalobiaceae bacterium]
MQKLESVQAGSRYMGRLSYNADLLDALTEICRERGVTLGRVEAIGALQKARLGYYDQQSRQYQFLVWEKGLEITSLMGNISLKEGEPMVHAHLTLADEAGRTYGGHLARGCHVFACEFILQAFSGPDLVRSYEERTGLPLWS